MPLLTEALETDLALFLAEKKGLNTDPGHEVRPFHYKTVRHWLFWKRHIKFYYTATHGGDTPFRLEPKIVEVFPSVEEMRHRAFLDRMQGYTVVEDDQS